MTALPAIAVSVPPVHVVEAPGGVATSIPAGKLSVKSRLSAANLPAELSILKLTVLVSPCSTLEGTNPLSNNGGAAALTVNVADAGPLLP